ncbi:protein OXIDATIVE STRESS 3 LIKE 1-like [Malania oleifera]|uniref:protein OXIDATIVE STRESS 3 LIKE 1-like n=1 Tax=Malania oleifera TaxID=397392 RepID=UPI0025AE5ABF|nr:protein OXIDATIVE STRESS 3 LIKE 1-like [Malania oleifera]
MEKETESTKAFDMGALRTNLPQKRGLSRYYSGKARSFTCITDAQCLEDLKKRENPEAKKRKKVLDMQEMQIPPYPCRRVSSTTQCATPCVGA